MPRFFVPAPPDVGGTAVITGDDARHIAGALRMAPGEPLTLCDGVGQDYLCRIESVARDAVTLRVERSEKSIGEPSLSVTLYMGLPKADKLELVIQKSVELGAVRIVPTVTARSIARIDPRDSEKKTARWQTIAAEAAGQSGRGIIPTVEPPITLRAALPRLARENVLLCDEGGGAPLGDLVSPADESVSLLIGPEGGFAPEEVEAVVAGGGRLAPLGTRILRCETAPLAALAILQEAARKK